MLVLAEVASGEGDCDDLHRGAWDAAALALVAFAAERRKTVAGKPVVGGGRDGDHGDSPDNYLSFEAFDIRSLEKCSSSSSSSSSLTLYFFLTS